MVSKWRSLSLVRALGSMSSPGVQKGGKRGLDFRCRVSCSLCNTILCRMSFLFLQLAFQQGTGINFITGYGVAFFFAVGIDNSFLISLGLYLCAIPALFASAYLIEPFWSQTNSSRLWHIGGSRADRHGRTRSSCR
jgi:hypothetical protein